jgi:small subunit ribosomal protein S5
MMQSRRRKPEAGGEKEMDQKVIDLARVTRVMAGGKRMRFRACVAIGDKRGRCGVGLAKGADVTIAINKAVTRAKKTLIHVPIVRGTIPHQVFIKDGSARILLKPAPEGTGIKVGGAIRMIFELAGVPNVSGKIMGTNNKINNVQAVLKALASFKSAPRPFKPKIVESEMTPIVGDMPSGADKKSV